MARSTPPPPFTPDDIESQFYEALQRGDLERLMALWSDDDEICCVHPGGQRVIGAAAIRASFEALFASGGIDARPEQVRRLQTHACVVHSVLEQVRVATPGGAQTAWVVSTNVYVKATSGWRLVAHHASPGGPGGMQDLVEPSGVLH